MAPSFFRIFAFLNDYILVVDKSQYRRAIAFVSDVSVNETFVTSLSELFTKEQLSPMHLQDAIEDNLP